MKITRPKSKVVIIAGRRIKKGMVIEGQTIPAFLAGQSTEPAKLKVVAVSKERKMIKLRYINRFLDNEPAIAQHRTIVFSFDEFADTHWIEKCPTV